MSPYLWLPLGVLLRLALLALAGETQFVADEANYFYLALAWERFGVLLDTERYLWPPGYLALVRLCLTLFGEGAVLALHVVQVVVSAAVGWACVRLAQRLFERRAAHIAGALWALHLPLAAYTHMAWPETLFLALLAPAVVLVVEAATPGSAARAADGKLIVAGLLLGASILVKDVGLGLLPLLGAAILVALRPHPLRERLRRASLPVLVAVAVLAPWAMRNHTIYGHAAPAGITLGENAYHGLNARYVNFDHRLVARVHGEGERLEASARSPFVVDDPEQAWERAEHTNTALRSSENVRRGVEWARAHPGDFARSRVKKLADLLAPQSFFLRHQALGVYRGPLGSAGWRRPLVVWALLTPALLLLLGVPGALGALRDPAAAPVLGITLLYFLLTGLLVAMSRFSLPLVPFLIVVAAGFLSRPSRGWPPERARRAAIVATLALLAFLWWVDLPEVREMARLAWS